MSTRLTGRFCCAHVLWRRAVLVLACAATPCSAWAETPDPRDIFAPLTLPDPASATRSVSGVPGAGYWQNRVDYAIDARIDTVSHVLTGHETITYVNNSPDALDVLWLQLDQNIYRADARAAVSRRCCHYTDGDELDRIEVELDGRSVTPSVVVSDTRLRISLPEALGPHGGTVQVRIDYHYTIPGPWGGRTAVTPSSKGEIFEIAQWYPRMAVYDDLRGWDTLPYLGSEFLLRIRRHRLSRHGSLEFHRSRFRGTAQCRRGADNGSARPAGAGRRQRRDRDDPATGRG